MAEITKIFSDNGINIDSMITCRQDENSYEIVVRIDAHQELLEKIKNQLESRGHKIIHIVQIG